MYAVVFRQAVVRGIEEFVLPFELSDQGKPPGSWRRRPASSWAAANVRGLGFARLVEREG